MSNPQTAGSYPCPATNKPCLNPHACDTAGCLRALPSTTPPPVPKTTIEWRLSVFAPDSDREVAFLLLTPEQAKALGAEVDGTMMPVSAFVGGWQK